MDARILRVGTIIVHNTTNKRAKITDAYHPPDNPFVVSITYKYIETDRVRTIIDSTLEHFSENWTVLEENPV
tara:strand:- start:96 stop:311 length:216 start_codon:yes stop_codon:yes gene_type:complete